MTIVMAAAAWACMCYPAITLSSVTVRPGQEITVTGSGFSTATSDATVIRFNALDGPVLATAPGPLAGGNLSAAVQIPQDTQPGNYVFVITRQDADGKLTMAPVRAAVTIVGDTAAKPVVGAAPSAVDTTVRASGFARGSRPLSTGALALVALGTGGVGMFLAGIAGLVAGRRRAAPATASVAG